MPLHDVFCVMFLTLQFALSSVTLSPLNFFFSFSFYMFQFCKFYLVIFKMYFVTVVCTFGRYFEACILFL